MLPIGETRLLTPISQRQFELYTLSLERSPIFSAYQARNGGVTGCILLDPARRAFTTLAMHRGIDHCWIKVDESAPYSTPETTPDPLSISMRTDGPAEPLPPGAKRRPLLLKPGPRSKSPEFDLLRARHRRRQSLSLIPHGQQYLD